MNEFAKPNLAVSQIPSSSVADAGKALVVGEDGVPIWGSGGGGSGGGVDFVNVTFVCSAYSYGLHPSMAVVGGVTYVGGAVFVEVGNPVTVGFPKLGNGQVKIGLMALDNIDKSTMPQVSGEATLDLERGELVVSGDCTFTAAGSKTI